MILPGVITSLKNKTPQIIPQIIVIALLAYAADKGILFITCCHTKAYRNKIKITPP